MGVYVEDGALGGILRVGWPHSEIRVHDYPKQVAAPNRFSWP